MYGFLKKNTYHSTLLCIFPSGSCGSEALETDENELPFEESDYKLGMTNVSSGKSIKLTGQKGIDTSWDMDGGATWLDTDIKDLPLGALTLALNFGLTETVRCKMGIRSTSNKSAMTALEIHTNLYKALSCMEVTIGTLNNDFKYVSEIKFYMAEISFDPYKTPKEKKLKGWLLAKRVA